MQDEEMDDIIRDAASQHHPAYDDKAWSRMENLLNKHLPQKKDNRKYILFFLLFLLLGAGMFYAHLNTNKNGLLKTEADLQDNLKSKNTTSSTATVTPQNNLGQVNTLAGNKNGTVSISTVALEKNSINEPVDNNTKTNNKVNIRPVQDKLAFKTKAKFKSKIGNSAIAEDNTNIDEAAKQNETTDDIVSNDKTTITMQRTQTNAAVIKDSNEVVYAAIDSSYKINNKTAQPIIAAVKKSSTDKKDEHKFKNNFAFTASAGPGLSYVGLDNPGKTTFTYGAGIAYSVSKKFTLRTGFYVSSKIYSANPSDYHPPKSFWQYYPDLKKIDANCKVYEIPVSITYNFKQQKKHNWFAATALASYIMKDENYDYYSTDIYGQTQYRNADISNKNKNIFSILTISGGYQYHINNTFSVMAEPYIELPLNGIGFGQINLNSSGLLFTIVIKPFASKK